MKSNLKNNKFKIAVIGGGYVGLPLATELGKYFKTILIDKDKERVKNINNHIDLNFSVSKKDFKNSKYLNTYTDLSKSKHCNVYIFTLPTPINKKNEPDLSILNIATKKISNYLNHEDLLIYESTVYPGATMEVFKPIIEKHSNLGLFQNKKINKKKYFHLGYSPERINPSDKINKLVNTKKIISASSDLAMKKVKYIYKKIIKKGIYSTKNIEEAESAKLLENIQRDCNIALMNEYSLVMQKLGINYKNVLQAASTKWNFVRVKPGLVGGHCLAVDPYYLIYKSKKKNYLPKIISSSRKINENFYKTVFLNIKKKIFENKNKFEKLNILVMGITYKENCPDIRNSQVFKLINEFNRDNKNFVYVFEPLIQTKFLNNLSKKNNFIIYRKKDFNKKKKFDFILYALNHQKFKSFSNSKLTSLLKSNGKIFDLSQRFNYNNSRNSII